MGQEGHACKDRLNLMSNHFTADNGIRTGFNRFLCMALCTSESVQSAKNNAVLLFGLLVVAILISNQFQCVISQMKENKFLIRFINLLFLSRNNLLIYKVTFFV